MNLKEKEKVVYEFIVNYVTENGYAPTYREISEGTDVKSLASVNNHIRKLSEKGLISAKKGEPRAIKIHGYSFTKL